MASAQTAQAASQGTTAKKQTAFVDLGKDLGDLCNRVYPSQNVTSRAKWVKSLILERVKELVAKGEFEVVHEGDARALGMSAEDLEKIKAQAEANRIANLQAQLDAAKKAAAARKKA